MILAKNWRTNEYVQPINTVLSNTFRLDNPITQSKSKRKTNYSKKQHQRFSKSKIQKKVDKKRYVLAQ